MSLYLPATLGPLVRSAADDVGRYSMNGVQVTDPGNGTFRCVVSDGRALLVAQGVCPDRGRLRDGPPDYQPTVVVPSAAWNEAFRKTKNLTVYRPKWKGDPPVTIAWDGNNRLELGSEGRSLQSAPLDGRFPDWTTIIPNGNPAFSMYVNPEMLADLLLTVARLLPEDCKRVTLAFWKDHAPLAVVAKDSTGLCLDALLMPLTPSPSEVAKDRREREERKQEEEEQEDEIVIRCAGCGFKGFEREFADDKCPKCGSESLEEYTGDEEQVAEAQAQEDD